MTCTVEGCKRKLRAKGMCNAHYQRKRTGVNFDHPIRDLNPGRGCRVDGCNEPHNCKDLCKTHHRRWRLFGEKSLTLPDYCEMCGRTDRLVVDHDHACCPTQQTCGECIRGRLCHWCNAGLGLLQDDLQRVEAGVAYLKRGME